MVFPQLSTSSRERIFRDLRDQDAQSVIVTLLDGGIAVGDLPYYTDTVSDPLELMFNTTQGEKFGSSFIVNIPFGLIADIAPLTWEKDSLGNEPIRGIGNPLATVICLHNRSIADHHNLTIDNYAVKAFDPNTVPPAGIIFDADEIIYADWEYFERAQAGAPQAGVALVFVSASYSPKASIATEVKRSLRDRPVEKVRNWVLRKSSDREPQLSGYIALPRTELTTLIEGEECVVCFCTDEDRKPAALSTVPVLLKKSRLTYPPEFLPLIRSELRFFGEVKQIPVTCEGVTSNVALLARAIGFLAPR